MKDKQQTFEKVAALLREASFTIIDKDDSRPWGGFYVIDEAQAARFAQHYFAEENLNELIQQQPGLIIGEQVNKRFAELPYLFKILDVKEMLSIQVHPSKESAAKGFS